MLHCHQLKDRVYQGRTGAFVCQASQTSVQLGAYKAWSNSPMEKAFSAVTKEGLSIRRAALQFNVPKSSLGDQVSGCVAHGTMSGPPKYLTDAEEIRIVHFLT